MEGSSISLIKKANRTPDPSELYVEEYAVAEVSLDDDVTQHEEVEEYHASEKEDEADSSEETANMQYEIDDHHYISQKIKQTKQSNTKYIICSPEEPLDAYKTSWTRCMTQILIEEYKNMIEDFRNPHKKQKDLWYEVANNMCNRGCDVTWDMCDRKWRNLKHTFKTIYYNQQRPAKSKRRWEFYNALEELFTPLTSDEAVRKSRTISPPPLDDQGSPIPSKIPRITPVTTPQVLDISGLQNQIITYPQIVLCDQNGIPINKKPCTPSTSKSVLSDSEASSDPPPSWFLEFMKQYRMDEERRLAVLKEMHAEVIQVEKRKCVALETLIKKLAQ
ncbi:uncharacterized protein [Periplaneta americana]|uniref:uncharacterized protein n=1 Tax=Periplaneta americana TaxID=6978 RepID=UPI0037E8D420